MSPPTPTTIPVFSPAEVIMIIESVANNPANKDELIAIIRRSMKLEEQRKHLSDIINDLCRKAQQQFDPSTANNGAHPYGEDGSPSPGYSPQAMHGISYDKSQSRYRTSYKKDGKLYQKVFSIRAHGESGALQMALEQRSQWIKEGKVTPKGNELLILQQSGIEGPSVKTNINEDAEPVLTNLSTYTFPNSRLVADTYESTAGHSMLNCSELMLPQSSFHDEDLNRTPLPVKDAFSNGSNLLQNSNEQGHAETESITSPSADFMSHRFINRGLKHEVKLEPVETHHPDEYNSLSQYPNLNSTSHDALTGATSGVLDENQMNGNWW